MVPLKRNTPEKKLKLFDSLAKFLLPTFIIMISLGITKMSHAVSIDNVEESNTTGLLTFNNGEQALLVNAKVHFAINGPIVSTTYEQTFANQSAETLVGTYSFPLPDNSAITSMEILLADRIIKGKIKEKAQAKKIFTEAVKTGKKASLVTQQRPNLFTNKIANIGSGEQLTVRINYVQTALYEDGQFQLRFPMTYTPRYSSVFDPVNTQEAFVHAKQNKQQTSNNIDITATVNMGFDDTIVSSNSHAVTSYIDLNQDNSIQFTIDPIRTLMDRDFVLNWYQPSIDKPRVGHHETYINGEHYGLLTIYPPTTAEQDTVMPRDTTFVIDVSGSMQGQSIEQAKQSLLFALSQLTSQDSFNIITFESTHKRLFNASVLATESTIHLAKEFVSSITADGGTEMLAPLIDSLKMGTTPAQLANAIKQVVFITDGAVGNESTLFKAIETHRKGHRLFMVAIGSAPNQFFIRKSSEFGQGNYINIENINEVNEKMTRFYHQMSQPVLTNLALETNDNKGIEYYPSKLPDLFLDRPLFIGYKSKAQNQTINLSGLGAVYPWSNQVEIATELSKDDKNEAISSVWANAKITSLLDYEYLNGQSESSKARIIDTSITHNILSPYTAFIAVEEYPSESPATAAARIKNLLPAGTPLPQTATGWRAQLMMALFLLLVTTVLYKRHQSES